MEEATFGCLDFKLILEAKSEVNARYVRCISLIPKLDSFQSSLLSFLIYYLWLVRTSG